MENENILAKYVNMLDCYLTVLQQYLTQPGQC